MIHLSLTSNGIWTESKGGRRIAPSTQCHITMMHDSRTCELFVFILSFYFFFSLFSFFILLFSSTILIIINRYFSLDSIYRVRVRLFHLTRFSKYDTFAWSRLLDQRFWTKEMPALNFPFSCIFFCSVEPDHRLFSLFFYGKKSRHFRSLVLLSETR